MNQKELNEIRRRITLDRSSITHIYGCYVNGNKEIISYIDESVGLMPKEEADKYIGLMKKSLSGALGKNLMDITFATKQVADSDEHRLLTALRKSELKDENTRETFYKCVIESLDMGDSNYVILLAHDSYDVPHYGRDGARDNDAASETFKYILCSICPVKSGKAELGFYPDEKRFHNKSASQIVASPAIGFMFPTFDDRSTNIYNALFYSHNTQEIHQDFIDAVFRTEIPMSAGQQMESFRSAMSESLEKECSYEVVQSVHEQLSQRIELHKESKDPEPLRVTSEEMSSMLKSSGMNEEKVQAFKEECDRQFGEKAEISPANIINKRKFVIETPEVTVSLDPKYSYMVHTKVINGRKYILIPADNGVEVNGISVHIKD